MFLRLLIVGLIFYLVLTMTITVSCAGTGITLSSLKEGRTDLEVCASGWGHLWQYGTQCKCLVFSVGLISYGHVYLCLAILMKKSVLAVSNL